MRAVSGLIILVKNFIKHEICKKISPEYTERDVGKDSGRRNGLDNVDRRWSVKNNLKIPYGEIMFTSILITFCVYGYTIEPESMNKGMYNKIDTLFNMQDYEKPTQQYF